MRGFQADAASIMQHGWQMLKYGPLPVLAIPMTIRGKISCKSS